MQEEEEVHMVQDQEHLEQEDQEDQEVEDKVEEYQEVQVQPQDQSTRVVEVEVEHILDLVAIK